MRVMDGSTLQPVATQDWTSASRADIPRIPELAIDPSHYEYVHQGHHRTIYPEETITDLGSDSFSFCSGLLLTDPETQTITMAHLEPHSETILRYLDEKPKYQVKKIALFYGSLSVKQWDLEDLIAKGYFGPVRCKTAHFVSGDTHWGMVFNRVNSQVKIFTRKPAQIITTYET